MLLDGETGKQYSLDLLPLEHGDLIFIRSDPPMPADQAVQLRELVQTIAGKKLLIGTGPSDWSWELMGRVGQEALLARLADHLKQTWHDDQTPQ